MGLFQVLRPISNTKKTETHCHTHTQVQNKSKMAIDMEYSPHRKAQ